MIMQYIYITPCNKKVTIVNILDILYVIYVIVLVIIIEHYSYN